MMRSLKITFVLAVCGLLPAQVAKDAAAKSGEKTPAAKKYEELGKKQGARMAEIRSLERDKQQEAGKEAQLARVEDLKAFSAEFPDSPEATKAALEIGTLAMRNADLKDAGIAAIQGVKLKDAEVAQIVQAAGIAGKLGVEDAKQNAIKLATEKLGKADIKTVLAASESAGGLGLTEQKDAWLAQAEKAAKTDEEKAKVMMFTAKIARRAKDDAKAKELYAEVAKLYPKTSAGRIASGKLVAPSLKEGSELIAFTGKDLEGKDVGPASYKGKVLLIDFWATWCGPCMQEMPNVIKTYNEYHAKGFDILGISLDREGDRAKLETCLKDNKMPWKQIYDGQYWEAEIAQLYDVNSIPFTLLIGKDGKIIGKGLRGPKLEEAVKKAIEASPQ